MSEDKPKKKRFEGLIQFKEALRQTIVCLQASMEDRFAHSLQSAWIRRLDENSELAYHLLFAMGREGVGTIDDASQLEAKHLVARIYQQQTDDLKSEIRWHGAIEPHISLWLDPADPLITSYFFRLVSLACNETSCAFDLKQCLAWGGMLRSAQARTADEARTFIHDCSKAYGLSADRVATMESFLNHLAALVSGYDSVHLIADGSYIGFVVEGRPDFELPASGQPAIDRLLKTDAHTIAINCEGVTHGKCQFAMLTPIRIQSKSVGPMPLKGFILLHSVRRAGKEKQSELAS